MIDKKLLGILPENVSNIKKVVLFKLIALCASIAIIIGFQQMFDQKIHNYLLWVIVLSVFLLIKLTFYTLAQKQIVQTSNNTKTHLRKLLYQKLNQLGTSFQGRIDVSNISQLLTEGVDQLEVYFALYLPQFFYAMISPVVLFLVLSFTSLKVALILLVLVPLIPISIIFVQKIAKKILNKYWDSYLNLGSSFLDSMQGLSTLKSFSMDDMMHQRIREESESFRKATMRVLIMQLNSISVMDCVAYGGSMLAIVVAYIEWNHQRISFGSFILFVLISSEFFIPMRLLGSYFHIAMNGAAASDKIFNFLNLTHEENNGLILEKIEMIKAKDLDYAYNEKKVLSNLNFTIKSNTKVAFVGNSGSGKSTLLALLARQLKTDDLYVNTQSIQNFNLESYFDSITLVSSKSEVFKGSFRSNLEMSGVCDERRMIEVLKQVQLLNYIEQNDGLDSVVLERGSNLSGGERQRLILARALLKDVDVFLLDEITSNVDVESERIIMDVIHNLRNKTIIMVSHRLKVIENFDQIFVLEEGQIKESGTHEYLIQKNALYAHYYQTQKRLECSYD